MILYLAAAWSRKAEARTVSARIERECPTVTVNSRWLGEEQADYYPPDKLGRARMDLEDVDACDVLVRLSDGLERRKRVPAGLASGARMYEQGYAAAKNKCTIVVGGPQHVFDFLPNVVHVPSVDALISWLKVGVYV
jgi:hypothetical protein